MLDLPLYLVANERPLINIDATLPINILIWVALFLFLRTVLWGPMIALITKREEGIEGARAEARRLEADARRKRDEFDLALRNARTTAAAERERLRTEGVAFENDLLAKVRAEVASSVEKQRAEIHSQREKLRHEVLATVPALAADIAGRILGREVRS